MTRLIFWFSTYRRFLWDQEKELWDIFHELDRDGDGKLDQQELATALRRSGEWWGTQNVVAESHILVASPFPGIEMSPSTLRDFVSLISSGSRATGSSHAKDNAYITFSQFRDFLIMLPRKASMPEIYKCKCRNSGIVALHSYPHFPFPCHHSVYQVKKRYPDGRGAARVNMEGDLNVSFPKTLSTSSSTPPSSPRSATKRSLSDEDSDEDLDDLGVGVIDGHDGHIHTDDDEYEDQDISGVNVAWKFLLAGGIAGLGK